MRRLVGSLWSFEGRGALVIPTNLCTRRDGTAVMGRGVALQAASRFQGLESWYGQRLREGRDGIVVYREGTKCLVLFPTKEDWRMPSSMRLIARGAQDLATESALRGDVYLPPVGTGCGRLGFAEVVAELHRWLLEDRFVLVTPPR